MFNDIYALTSGPESESVLADYFKDLPFKAGTYNNGMFTLFDSEYSTKINVEAFSYLLGREDYVPFGISALGDLFLFRASDTTFHILETQGLTFGPIEVDVNNFFNDFLINVGVIDSVLNKDYVNDIYGALNKTPDYGNCYVLTPYSFLGGEDNPSNYSVGDFAVYMELINQTLDQNPNLKEG
jgi:hypothetical protein